MKSKDKELIKEVVGWIVKGMFNRSVKTAQHIIKNDPKFREMVKNIAVNIKKSEDEMDAYLEKRFGGTPEEIEAKAKKRGMSVEEYIRVFLRGKKHLVRK